MTEIDFKGPHSQNMGRKSRPKYNNNGPPGIARNGHYNCSSYYIAKEIILSASIAPSYRSILGFLTFTTLAPGIFKLFSSTGI